MKARTLTVHSTTPGYSAVIRSSSSPSGGFVDDSANQVAGTTTTFTLNGNEARYYLIWITHLGPADQVSLTEATAT